MAAKCGLQVSAGLARGSSAEPSPVCGSSRAVLGTATGHKKFNTFGRLSVGCRPGFGMEELGRRSSRSTRGSPFTMTPTFRCGTYFDDSESFHGVAAQARDLLSDGGEGEQSFWERLALAWSILFPPFRRRVSSNAEVAKQRLKMILISDRCSVNDDAKRRIVDNIVGALSDFVEIEAEDKVQLTVSSDTSLGTVYSVTVPVRRVRPEYQEFSRELQNAALTEEFAEDFRTLDIQFEYPDATDAPTS